MKQSVGSVHVWVGLNDIGTEGDWEWVSGYECDGECSALSWWNVNEPNNSGGEDCGHLRAGASSIDVLLNDIPCTYTGINYFLCDAPTYLVNFGDCKQCEECEGDCDNDDQCAGDLVCFYNGAGETNVPPGCHGTASNNWDYCYNKLPTENPTAEPTSVPTSPTEQPTGIPTANPTEEPSEYVMEHQTAISWSDANAYCASTYGTTLATIKTDIDANTVLAMKQNIGSVRVWVGLNDIGTEGDWEWVSGYECEGDCTALSWWNTNEPNDSSGEDCAHLRASASSIDVMLNDIPCTYTVDYFLCDAPPHLVDVELDPNYALAECEGDCDNDSDCEGDLVCFHNVDGSSDVAPGCQGTATANWDYCYDKLPTDNPTVDPTSVPTTSPTRGPSTDPTEQPTGIPTANPTEKPSEYVMEHQTAISWSDANAYCAG